MRKNEIMQFVEKCDVIITTQNNDEFTIIAETLAKIARVGDRVRKAYSELLPLVAKLDVAHMWDVVEGCKSSNHLLVMTMGCPKSTASELLLVARTFYENDDCLLDLPERYSMFNYTHLLVLARLEPDVREMVVDRLLQGDFSSLSRNKLLAMIDDITSEYEFGSATIEAEPAGECYADTDSVENPEETGTLDKEAQAQTEVYNEVLEEAVKSSVKYLMQAAQNPEMYDREELAKIIMQECEHLSELV